MLLQQSAAVPGWCEAVAARAARASRGSTHLLQLLVLPHVRGQAQTVAPLNGGVRMRVNE